MGFGNSQKVVGPSIAYPTYEFGAKFAGCNWSTYQSPTEILQADLVWINSPSNPTGRILELAELRELVQVARKQGAIIASDECYFELSYGSPVTSILDPLVNDGDLDSILCVHSLSKRYNAAGLRFGFVAGDQKLISYLLEARKHLGLMVPANIQAAATLAYTDNVPVKTVHKTYESRHNLIKEALHSAKFEVQHSSAGLYLWATQGQSCWQTVDWFANRGILVAPGDFYEKSSKFVRIALTVSDAECQNAGNRITS